MMVMGQPFQREIQDVGKGREQGSGETHKGLGAGRQLATTRIRIPVFHQVWEMGPYPSDDYISKG